MTNTTKRPQSDQRGNSKKAERPLQPTETITAEQQDEAQKHAHFLKYLRIPALFRVGLDKQDIGVFGAKIYFNTMLTEAGNPTDPIERMLVEQLIMVHHRVADLHASAATASCPENVKLYNSAAVRLQGEFRRLALALRQYRTPPSPRSFNVVHQQNVVATGDQQVSYVDQSAGDQTKVSFSARSKQEGNPNEQPIGGRFSGQEEPAASGGGQGERLQTAGVEG